MEMEFARRIEVRNARRELVLHEQRLGHYDEFRRVFVEQLELEQPQKAPIYFLQEGRIYEMEFGDTAGLPYPSDLKIYLILQESQVAPSSETINQDLWALFEWAVEKIGGEWKLEEAQQFARDYRIHS